MRRLKKILLWLLCAMCISILLGMVDCWLAGTKFRNTLFSRAMWKMLDGSTTGYLGFGYTLIYYRKLDGEQGPEIWYWFAPCAFYHTTERTGVRWLFSSEPKEPTYQGRTLSQWISVFFRGYSGNSTNPTLAESDDAKRAIRAMGTNTIPTLIAWLSEDHPGTGRRGDAQLVFELLGETAKPAAPALVELTKNNDKQIRLRAFLSLLAVKPPKEILVPVLTQLIHDPDKTLAYEAACELVDLDAAAAKSAGVDNLFPQMPGLDQIQTGSTNTTQSQ
jgi:hypothetical protein